jgi:hypothetical protein
VDELEPAAAFAGAEDLSPDDELDEPEELDPDDDPDELDPDDEPEPDLARESVR